MTPEDYPVNVFERVKDNFERYYSCREAMKALNIQGFGTLALGVMLNLSPSVEGLAEFAQYGGGALAAAAAVGAATNHLIYRNELRRI